MPSKKVDATLLYAQLNDPIEAVDIPSLVQRVEALGFEIECISCAEHDHITVTMQGVRLRIAYREKPVSISALREAFRPSGTEAKRRQVLRILAYHKASLTISALDRTANCVVAGHFKERLVREIVVMLLETETPALVLCPGSDRLMTRREATAWLAGMPWEESVVSEEDHDLRLQGTSLLRAEPRLSTRARRWLRSDDRARAHQGALLGVQFASPAGPSETSVARTPAGRAALYVMSATIGVFALPIGAAALAYNALSGGSMRWTAHAMAATGVACAVNATGWSSGVFQFLGI